MTVNVSASRRRAGLARGRASRVDGAAPSADAARDDLFRLRVVAAVALVAGLTASPRLWVSVDRLYPTAPVHGGLPPLTATLEGLLLAALVAALAWSALRPGARLPIACGLAAIALFTVWDQSRLQPWVYVYAALLAIANRDMASEGKDQLAKHQSAKHQSAKHQAPLMTARLVLVAIYFWSGLQKANASFLAGTWPEFAAPLIEALPAGLAGVARRSGALVPLTECAIAFALLAPRLRRAGVVAAIGVHATILALLLGAGANSVVWSWNVAMPIVAFILFWDTGAAAREVLAGDRSALHAAFAVAFGVLPALSFLGLWDPYLSSALYSGNTAQAVVLVEPEAVGRLPPVVRRNTWHRTPPAFIDLNRWSYEELNVPAYPAQRVLKRVGREVCRAYDTSGTMVLQILGRPDWRTGNRPRQSFACDDPTW